MPHADMQGIIRIGRSAFPYESRQPRNADTTDTQCKRHSANKIKRLIALLTDIFNMLVDA
ncbi:hypothetical protein XU19_20040 [Vibrio parahaemolyticus]|nr:hypothetical protein XU19_20040 [Vibrio parahaemolyticus]KKY44356.1 hypothetical protein AAY51_01460 [Vibrio parahaemolyticus]KOP98942.1 hypothetical protein AL012_01455 [Citrobacter amalonaticus]KOQ00550.1 hypothetical protein ALC61_04455 [Citrobacter amalonaticus]HAU5794295.1 hypothetical protein [Citrobacter amalonaticus]